LELILFSPTADTGLMTASESAVLIVMELTVVAAVGITMEAKGPEVVFMVVEEVVVASATVNLPIVDLISVLRLHPVLDNCLV